LRIRSIICSGELLALFAPVSADIDSGLDREQLRLSQASAKDASEAAHPQDRSRWVRTRRTRTASSVILFNIRANSDNQQSLAKLRRFFEKPHRL
jgi:hypothetical protein